MPKFPAVERDFSFVFKDEITFNRIKAAIHEPWIYDASYAKLRETRVTIERQLTFLPVLRDATGRLSIIGRNLATWAKAPNIDPETALASGVFQGFEMGQLPGTRSVGIAISVTP